MFYVEGVGVVHCTLTPASLCGPRMYSYCSMLRVSASPKRDPVFSVGSGCGPPLKV